ncbi:MAG TPA: hypothetical protein VIN93_01495, partial [Bryobacteraceae bacterium]
PYWQAGYAAFTVSGSRAAAVKDYIAGQQGHHRRVSFQDELLSFLEGTASVTTSASSRAEANLSPWGFRLR